MLDQNSNSNSMSKLRELCKKAWKKSWLAFIEKTKSWVTALVLSILAVCTLWFRLQIATVYHLIKPHIPVELLWILSALLLCVLTIVGIFAWILWHCCKEDRETRVKIINLLKVKLEKANRQQVSQHSHELKTFTERLVQMFQHRPLRRTLAIALFFTIVSLSAGAYVYSQQFECTAAIFSDNQRPESAVNVVILKKNGETVTTGITQTDGRCTLHGKIRGSQFIVRAFREESNQISWMEKEVDLNKENSEASLRWFPDYVCDLESYGPFLFATDSSSLSSNDIVKIKDLNIKLLGKHDRIVIIGHTSRLPETSLHLYPNYELSLSRCEAVFRVLKEHIQGEVFVLAPFDYRLPRKDVSRAELGYPEQQCVRIIVLRTTHREPTH